MNRMNQVAINLYTLRKEAKNDLLGTLEKVSEIGYCGVEFAGFFNTPANRLKETLERLRMISVASHTPIEALRDNLDEVLRYNQTIGTKYIVCPWDQCATREEYRERAVFFNSVAKKISDAGMGFGYHNHAHEFELVDGKYGLDYLYELTDPKWVIPQLDIYWIYYAGIDPVAYIDRYAGRCKLIHLKDMSDNISKSITEVGNGILDIKGVMAKGLEIGAEWFAVEQDVCERPALESIRISYENVRRLFQELEEHKR